MRSILIYFAPRSKKRCSLMSLFTIAGLRSQGAHAKVTCEHPNKNSCHPSKPCGPYPPSIPFHTAKQSSSPASPARLCQCDKAFNSQRAPRILRCSCHYIKSTVLLISSGKSRSRRKPCVFPDPRSLPCRSLGVFSGKAPPAIRSAPPCRHGAACTWCRTSI